MFPRLQTLLFCLNSENAAYTKKKGRIHAMSTELRVIVERKKMRVNLKKCIAREKMTSFAGISLIE